MDSPIGYSGNWTDPDTGLIYLRARDYDPATAQFMTVDPQVDSTHQPYAYVANDPLGSADPSGLCPSVMPNCLTPADFGGNSWFLSPGPMAVGDALNSPIGKSASTVFEGIGDGPRRRVRWRSSRPHGCCRNCACANIKGLPAHATVGRQCQTSKHRE